MPVNLTDLLFRVRMLKKALPIIAQKEKTIKLLHFNYMPALESSDTLIIRYGFKNALWYELDGKITTEDRYITLRPENDEIAIPLRVQGVFTACTYTIMLRPENVCITEAE